MYYRRFLKRVFDFLIATLAFVLLFPIAVLVVVVLLLANRGSVFFFQTRPGLNEESFRIIKFKTMNDKKDSEGNLLSDAQRLTEVGRWVRRLSLDEIPQLLNVIKGDMSLIGPRPLLMEYLPLYSTEQKQRHNVRPGITGWAQVNGRNAIDWPTKFALDVWYVERLSPMLDAKIIGMTVLKVFKSEGISSDTAATMEKFTGTI